MLLGKYGKKFYEIIQLFEVFSKKMESKLESDDKKYLLFS